MSARDASLSRARRRAEFSTIMNMVAKVSEKTGNTVAQIELIRKAFDITSAAGLKLQP
jgi:hypothetical protein